MTIRTCILRCVKANRARLWWGVFFLLLVHAALAQTYTVLHSFSGPPDGAGPATLMLDAAGNLWGATQLGGNTTDNLYCSFTGCGTIFKIDASGNENVIYAFAPTSVFNGYYPDGPTLAQDTQGNIYGTTPLGGFFKCGVYGLGCGTVFKVSPSGQQTILHRFTDGDANGSEASGLVRDAAGNLYGTTGGNWGDGAVFKLDSQGHKTVLYTFKGYPNDGAGPRDLILDSQGNLYGLTGGGGARGAGTIFEISNTGVETILHDFGAPGSIGTGLRGTLVRDSAGDLYGVTDRGGDASCQGGLGCGVVYKLDPAGNYSVLHSFTGAADGESPEGGLALDAASNLYGTTSFGGGTDACGTVFKLSPSGSLTVLHTFNKTECGNDVVLPLTAPIVDANGNVYGTTFRGGVINTTCIFGCGVVFKITP